jgi:hypothetical protein
MVPVKPGPIKVAAEKALLIERAGPNGVVFTFPDLSNVTYTAWEDVMAAMLEFAFLGSPACLITPDPRDSWWEVNLREMYADVALRRVRQWDYLCVFDPCVSGAVLKAIAKSTDLYLGPIWIARLPRDDMQRWLALMERMFDHYESLTSPETPEEVIFSNPDGDWMYWLNPSRPEAAIVAKLARLAQANGWGLVSKLRTE